VIYIEYPERFFRSILNFIKKRYLPGFENLAGCTLVFLPHFGSLVE